MDQCSSGNIKKREDQAFLRGYHHDIEPRECISNAVCISFRVAAYEGRLMLSSRVAVDRESRGGGKGWFWLKDSLKGTAGLLVLQSSSDSLGLLQCCFNPLVWVALHRATSTRADCFLKADTVYTQTRSPHLGYICNLSFPVSFVVVVK